MNKQTLEEIITEALLEAKQRTKEELKKNRQNHADEGQENSVKSKCFVSSLRKRFECYYNKNRVADDNLFNRVESAGETKEFLHDIAVKCMESVQSPMRRSEIQRIRYVLWQIEIEMSKGAREFMEDLNKLGAGTQYSNKLFVVQRCWLSDKNNKNTWANKQVKEIAKMQKGQFFVAFIPHPKDWNMCTEQTIAEMIKVEESISHIPESSID